MIGLHSTLVWHILNMSHRQYVLKSCSQFIKYDILTCRVQRLGQIWGVAESDANRQPHRTKTIIYMYMSPNLGFLGFDTTTYLWIK